MSPPPDAPLDFDRWLDLAARSLGKSPDERDLLLEASDIDSEDWDAADRHWTEVIAQEILGIGGPRSDAYAKRCAEAMSQRETNELSPKPSSATGRERAAVADTDKVPEGLIELARALPFASPSDATAPRQPERPRKPPAASLTASGDTACLPEGLVQAILALPFSPAAKETRSDGPPSTPRSRTLHAPGGVALTLQQYASFSVEVSASGADRDEVLRKYRVSPQQAIALDHAWETMKKRDPGAEGEWREACVTFRAWLRGQRVAR